MKPSKFKSPATSVVGNPSRKARWSRYLPWVGALILVALIVIGLWPKAQPVELGTVVRGPMQVTVDEEGMTRVKNRYIVSSPMGGLLRRIDWKPGAMVEAGKTVLAVLDTRGADLLDARSQAQAEAQVHAAEAALEQVTAQMQSAVATAKLAHTDFERTRQLLAAGSVSRQEYEAAELKDTSAEQTSRAARFALNVAEFELQQARALLLRGQASGAGQPKPYVITSPVSGRVLRVYQESERVVLAGTPLVEVGDASDIEARIEVLSRDAVAIKPGARVELQKWGGVMPLAGRVRVVEPSAFTKVSALGVEEQRVNVIVDILDPLQSRPTLGDAYRVEAKIVTWEHDDVLKAPAGAFFQRGDQWETYMLSGRKATLKSVRLGHSNGLEAELLDGLEPGDEVIVYPGDRIADGVRVSPMTVDPR
jgi:HlyD family secretion protein